MSHVHTDIWGGNTDKNQTDISRLTASEIRFLRNMGWGRRIKTERIKVEKIRKNLQKNVSEDKIVTKEDGTYRL